VDNLTDMLARCVPLLRPGGHVVITARPHRVGDELIDLPGLIVAAGRTAGLRPAHRRAALVAKNTPPRLAPTGLARRSRDRGMPPVRRVAHHDVVVLRTPDQPAVAATRLRRDRRVAHLRPDSDLLRSAA
jgi:modification methylase